MDIFCNNKPKKKVAVAERKYQSRLSSLEFAKACAAGTRTCYSYIPNLESAQKEVDKALEEVKLAEASYK